MIVGHFTSEIPVWYVGCQNLVRSPCSGAYNLNHGLDSLYSKRFSMSKKRWRVASPNLAMLFRAASHVFSSLGRVLEKNLSA